MADSVGWLVDRVGAVGDVVEEVLLAVSAVGPPDCALAPRVRGDDRLRELLVGLERVRNAAEAAQSAVMVAMADEAVVLDGAEFAATGGPSRSHLEFVPDEIGVLLACTKVAAGVGSVWRCGRRSSRWWNRRGGLGRSTQARCRWSSRR